MMPRLVVALFLLAHSVLASQASNEALVSNSKLLELVNAWKRRIWRVHRDEVKPEWLRRYQLLPTERSVSRARELLLNGPSTILMVMIMKGISAGNPYPLEFLVEYTIFKASLGEHWSEYEKVVVKFSLLAASTGQRSRGMDIGALVDEFASKHWYSNLFLTPTVTVKDMPQIKSALSVLGTHCLKIASGCAEGYMRRYPQYDVSIPQELHSLLSERALNALERRSDEARLLCRNEQSRRPDLDDANATAVQSEGNDDYFNMDEIPQWIWITVMARLHYLPFEKYGIPLICSLWKELHAALSYQPLLAQAYFDSVNDSTKQDEMILNTLRLDGGFDVPNLVVRYALQAQGKEPVELGSMDTKSIKETWDWIVQAASQSRLQMSSKLYMQLYDDFCRASYCQLKFYQLPGMSDEEYIASVAELVTKYRTAPTIEPRFLGRDCETFFCDLKGNRDFFEKLFGDNQICSNRLATHLFLSGHHIPQVVHEVLHGKSNLYRLLMDRSCAARSHLFLVLQYYADDCDQLTLAQRVIEICLKELSNISTAGLEDTKRKIWRYLDLFSDQSPMSPSQRSLVKQKLSSAIMSHLCTICDDLSEEKFCSLGKVLEQLGIFDDEGRLHASDELIFKLLNDPQVVLELTH